MRYALALCLALLTSPAFAWTDGGSPLNLRIPALTDSGSSWTESLRYNFGKISTAAALGTSVSTATVIYNPLGNLALPYGLTASTFTATEYSSAPVMHVSTFAASGDFNFYTDDGDHALHIGAGTTSGLRVNQGTWAGGQSWNIELFNTSEPTFAFRRNKTSISDGQTLGGLYWRDHDTSTGGSGVKAYMKVNPRGNWGSNDPMETEFNWGLSRSGGTASDYMVLTSSGLNVSGAGSFSGSVTVGSMTSLGNIGIPNSAAIDFTDTIGTPRSMIGMGSTQVLKINYGGSWNTSINESGGSVGIGTASPATTLDVNGNAQFGSGATKSTFTATGGLTIASVSSITFASGGGGAIVWADGTVSTTSAGGGSSGGQTYYVSSMTIPNVSGSAPFGPAATVGATYGACIAGSTITVTTAANSVQIYFTGDATSNAAGARMSFNVLVDSGYIFPFTATRGIVNSDEITSAAYENNMSFTVETNVLSAGSHTFCLQWRVTSGTAYINYWNESQPTWGVRYWK